MGLKIKNKFFFHKCDIIIFDIQTPTTKLGGDADEATTPCLKKKYDNS